MSNKNRAPLITLAISAIVVLILLMTTGGSMYTVDQGERGVVLHYGEVSKVADPGLHFKWPYIDRVVRIPTRTTTRTRKDIFANSSDQQPAQIALSVTFAVADDGVEALYTQFGKTEKLYELVIVPIVTQEIKTVFGQFTAIRSVQHREELNNKPRDAIVTALAKYPYLHIESVQIENVDFSDAYEQTIEDRMKAEVEVERYKQNLERERIEAQIAATRAQGQADAQIKAAEAEAKAKHCVKTRKSSASRRQKNGTVACRKSCCQTVPYPCWHCRLPQKTRQNKPGSREPIYIQPNAQGVCKWRHTRPAPFTTYIHDERSRVCKWKISP